MTVPEALEIVRQAGVVEVHDGNLRLKFPEKERVRLRPALYTLRRCKAEALAMLGENPLAAVRPRTVGVNGVDTNQGEIALRWYCSTCGTGGVLRHSPKLTCDAKEHAILRAHSEQQPGCWRLDYRVMPDSEREAVS